MTTKRSTTQKYSVTFFAAQTYRIELTAQSEANARRQATAKFRKGKGEGFKKAPVLWVIQATADPVGKLSDCGKDTVSGSLAEPLFLV